MLRKVKGNILAVVGGQYGSEGKGVVVNHIANRYDVHVRVGGPNAGHSFNHDGSVFKMQVVPCGWTNRKATLVLGRGMLIDPEHLRKEVQMVERNDPTIWKRLLVDGRAGILSKEHHAEEGGTAGELHQRIGSTGEGVGASRLARIRRDPSNFKFFWEVAPDFDLTNLMCGDTQAVIMNQLAENKNVLLEGTQGSGLSLIHGPWPYVTSADTNAGQMAADVGIPPRFVNRTCLVVRTYPIRVAGNSGPLQGELTWADMSARVGKDLEERTTVTKKVRRVGEWDEKLFMQGVELNHPTSIALMFADYISPEDEGKRRFSSLSKRTRDFVKYVEDLSGVPVALIGTGGPTWAICDRGMAL